MIDYKEYKDEINIAFSAIYNHKDAKQVIWLRSDKKTRVKITRIAKHDSLLITCGKLNYREKMKVKNSKELARKGYEIIYKKKK